MNMSEQIQISGEGLRGKLSRDEPMDRHVSWRAGGRARLAYAPADLEDLALFLRGLPDGEPVCFVGLGSNLLVRDGGLDATVIFTHRALRGVRVLKNDAGGEIRVQAGVASPKVARQAALNNLAGAEFLAGIPGTIGGALAMNAGCYGGEIWDLVEQVETIDRSGTLRVRTPRHYNIGYRRVERRCRQLSSVPGAGGGGHGAVEEWFVSATLRCARGDGAQSRARITELLSQRIASQPLGMPNAGSVFRNPPGDHAARLIEECGLKGRQIGRASISAKHANFIINNGGASAADIEALIELAGQSVAQQFGVHLEPEVRIVGEHA